MSSWKSRMALAVVIGLALATPIGYLIGSQSLDSAESQIATDSGATELPAEAQNPEIENSAGVSIIPEEQPPADLVEDCKAHIRRGVETAEQADQVYSCEVLLLAAEGQIAPGTYTDAEIDRLKQGKSPDVGQ